MNFDRHSNDDLDNRFNHLSYINKKHAKKLEDSGTSLYNVRSSAQENISKQTNRNALKNNSLNNKLIKIVKENFNISSNQRNTEIYRKEEIDHNYVTPTRFSYASIPEQVIDNLRESNPFSDLSQKKALIVFDQLSNKKSNKKSPQHHIMPFEKARNKAKATDALERSKSLSKLENKMKNIEQMLKFVNNELKDSESSAQKPPLKLSTNIDLTNKFANTMSLKHQNMKKYIDLHQRFGHKSSLNQSLNERNSLNTLDSAKKPSRPKHNLSLNLKEPNT